MLRTQPGEGRSLRQFAERYSADNEANLINGYYERPAMIGLAGDVNGRRILDAGCGSGPLTAALRERGARASNSRSSANLPSLPRPRASSCLHISWTARRSSALLSSSSTRPDGGPVLALRAVLGRQPASQPGQSPIVQPVEQDLGHPEAVAQGLGHFVARIRSGLTEVGVHTPSCVQVAELVAMPAADQ